MKQKSIYIRLLLTLASLVLLLSACGQTDQTSPEASPDSPSTPPIESNENEGENSDRVNIQDSDKESDSQAQSNALTPLEIGSIVPESSTRRIESTDVWGYDHSLLQLAVNEIYARHGYVFQKDYLNDYFSHQAWYHPSDNFSEADLSDIEKDNIAFLKNHSPEKSLTTISIDTNGDGIVERFDVSQDLYARTDYGQGYVADLDSYDYAGSLITDLDINDGKMEIIAYDNGPSADFTLDILSPIDEDHFKEIQKFTSQYYDHQSSGDGQVTFELFDQMVYATADYTYRDGQFTQGTIHYPVFTIAQATDTFNVGDHVIFKGTGFNVDYSEPFYTLKLINSENSNQVENFEFGDDFTAYIEFLSSTLEEIGYMYYGD